MKIVPGSEREFLLDLMIQLSEFGVDPLIPRESKDFFLKAIEGFDGSKEDCINYIVKKVPEWFTGVKGLPDWIQNPEWQFSEGKPMLYVGQLEASMPGHQDSVFFLFWNPDNGEFKVVHQMY